MSRCQGETPWNPVPPRPHLPSVGLLLCPHPLSGVASQRPCTGNYSSGPLLLSVKMESGAAAIGLCCPWSWPQASSYSFQRKYPGTCHHRLLVVPFLKPPPPHPTPTILRAPAALAGSCRGMCHLAPPGRVCLALSALATHSSFLPTTLQTPQGPKGASCPHAQPSAAQIYASIPMSFPVCQQAGREEAATAREARPQRSSLCQPRVHGALLGFTLNFNAEKQVSFSSNIISRSNLHLSTNGVLYGYSCWIANNKERLS